MSTIHCFFFFFNDTATTEIYTLSLHDALPIFNPAVRCAAARSFARRVLHGHVVRGRHGALRGDPGQRAREDRKSTRLNSSHGYISYAVFCLKKKKTPNRRIRFGSL